MNEYSSGDQWRSFQTFVAAYLAGMLHARDIFTISRRESVAPPLVEFRCDTDACLWFSVGAVAWSDTYGASVQVRHEDANQVAAQTVHTLRELAEVDDPGRLRLSASGPASSVAVLAMGGFLGFGRPDDVDPARKAAQAARMAANIDVEGDVIEASARAVGDRAYAATNNGTIAAQAAAGELARLRPGSTHSARHPRPASWSVCRRRRQRSDGKPYATLYRPVSVGNRVARRRTPRVDP